MNLKIMLLFSMAILLLTACSAAPEIQASFDPADLKFDGERAFAIETELVTRFPDRASGYPNNQLAAEWIQAQMSAAGWDCFIDRWEIINYSQANSPQQRGMPAARELGARDPGHRSP